MKNLFNVRPIQLKLPMERFRFSLKKSISLFLLIFIWAWVMPTAVAQQSEFTAPATGDTLTGVVTITGTAVHPDFLRYELAFLNESAPQTGWIVFAENHQPVTNGTLAIWDTTVGRDAGVPVFPDGRYQLRLRVVKTDYNYDELFLANLTIHNAGPTPVPTPDEPSLTATAFAQTAVTPTLPESTPSQGTGSFNPPTPLPSLTPFATLTPQATAINLSQGEPLLPTDTTQGGLIGQLEAVDTSQFGTAFFAGVRLTVIIFSCLALYLILRAIGRFIWRKFWTEQTDHQ